MLMQETSFPFYKIKLISLNSIELKTSPLIFLKSLISLILTLSEGGKILITFLDYCD